MKPPHRERPLQPGSGQARESAFIGKARGMHDGVDGSERSARGMDEFGRGAFLCQVAGAPLNPGAGPLALSGHRFQAIKPGSISALSVQHQALIIRRQPPRDRRADPGSTSGND
jgi:hypothetical protein